MTRARTKVRGVFPRDGVYWIRWACPHGHLHREKVGPKGLARQEYEKRKVRARTEGYCPRRVAAPKAVIVSEAVKDFLAYAQVNKRSHADDRRMAVRITADFGTACWTTSRQKMSRIGRCAWQRKANPTRAGHPPRSTAIWRCSRPSTAWRCGTGRPRTTP